MIIDIKRLSSRNNFIVEQPFNLSFGARLEVMYTDIKYSIRVITPVSFSDTDVGSSKVYNDYPQLTSFLRGYKCHKISSKE